VSNYLIQTFVSTIYIQHLFQLFIYNYLFQLFVATIYINYLFQLFVATMYNNLQSICFNYIIQTFINYLFQLFVATIYTVMSVNIIYTNICFNYLFELFIRTNINYLYEQLFQLYITHFLIRHSFIDLSLISLVRIIPL
jgi:hypothetical protein